MKKIFLMAAAAVLAASCNNNGYVIKGTIEGLQDSVVYLMNADSQAIDSTTVSNGSFTFKGKVDTPQMVYLLTNRPIMSLFLENGKIQINGSITDITRPMTISGTAANEALSEYDQFNREMFTKMQQNQEDPAAIDSLYEAMNEGVRQRLDQNLDNLFGLNLYATQLFYYDSADEILAQIAKFPVEMQNTPELTDLKEFAAKKQMVEPGRQYIDIIQNDADGNPIALSSIVGDGKYVLVDFWASWCNPCMREVPYMLQAYAKYHDKGFEIYGVSLDKMADSWKSAIENHKMDWIHVCNFEAFDSPDAVNYAVRSIPANFLIGPDGTIVATGLRESDLENKLAELLGE